MKKAGTTVYRVEFVCNHADYDDAERVFFIGVYTTRAKARAAVRRLSAQPGFRELPEGFSISVDDLDLTHWEEGFVTVDGFGNETTRKFFLPSWMVDEKGRRIRGT